MLCGAHYPEEPAAGGGSLTYARIAEGLRKKGYDVRMITAVTPGYEHTTIPNIRCDNLVYTELTLPSLFLKLRGKAILKYDKKVIYHANDHFGAVFLGTSFILQLHSPNFTHRHIFTKQGLLTLLAAYFARYLLFYSQYSADQFVNIFKIDRSKCRVIGGGVDPVLLLRRKTSYEPKDTFIISTAGRPEYNKGTDILIEAAMVLKKRGRRISVNIYGNSDDKKKYEDMSKKLCVEDIVFFHGKINRNDLYAKIRDSDLFCFPSRFESFGLAVIEALALGVPVLSSNRTALNEFIRSDVANVIEHLDPALFANAVEECMDNYGRCREKVEAGIEYVREKYLWDRVVERVELVYQEFLA